MFPQGVKSGDCIAVIAPSSPFEPVLGWRALGFLKEKYQVKWSRDLFESRGYLAGDDLRRVEELQRALDDPDVSAIVAMRGGYGANRLIQQIDWSGLVKHPKWIVGFSDVTAIHIESIKMGIASIHGPNAASLGRGDAHARTQWTVFLESPLQNRCWTSLRSLGTAWGEASGCALGGNLTMLHAAAASGRLRIPEKSVLFLEDVTERPYRIDRMLTNLQEGGYFRDLIAMVIGEFTQCDPGKDGVTVEEVLQERLGLLNIPIVTGAPFGHGDRNEMWVMGQRVTVIAKEPAGESMVQFAQ